MSVLFTPARIGGLELGNRIVRTASHEGLADERGRPSDAQFLFYKGFIEGGVGLVTTGYAGVLQSGKSPLFRMTMIHSDDMIPFHRELVDRIHGLGGKIMLQIAHCGRQTWSSETGCPLRAPSPVPCGFYKERPEEMTASDIRNVTEAFADAARRAKKAGYDAVQIHGAHGYLLSTFLSSHSNRRSDEWGGPLENRFRFVGGILRSVRDAVGSDYPVTIKLNTFENARDGTTPEECVRTARMVEETGCCDAVELSCGTTEGGFVMARGAFPTGAVLKYLRPYCGYPRLMKYLLKTVVVPIAKRRQPPFVEGYNLDTSSKVKKAVSLPVITVGGMRSKKFMEEAIESGKTDFVSMARPLIMEPDLPNKFRTGSSAEALCDNCNWCVAASDTRSIQCYRK